MKPFLLVIARDTTHAAIDAADPVRAVLRGALRGKVIQVDSSKTGAEEDEMVAAAAGGGEHDEPTEIVIHVNMLKEGWDVTNLYTIVPLRAANARTLIEQSIGRGLRLPYGKRTGVAAVDRLNIVAHDKFQEIIDEANRPDSIIRLQHVILDPSTDLQKTVTVVSQPLSLASQLGIQPCRQRPAQWLAPTNAAPAFHASHLWAEQQVVGVLPYEAIRKLESQPQTDLPSISISSES